MSAHPPPFDIRVAQSGDGLVRVHVTGELDLTTSPELADALRREIEAGKRVVLDLSKVAFIDSTGLSTLIGAVRSAESNGASLSVSPRLPSHVSRVFDITGLTSLLPMASE
jgi:anti-sigma B factor antagonist